MHKIVAFLLIFFATTAAAETYECKGFEPEFSLMISDKEMVLERQEEALQHFVPIQVAQGNNARIKTYRAIRPGKPDMVVILDEVGVCNSELEGKFTHHVYVSGGKWVVDGCCNIKK